jgi:hypothetical protein
MLARKDVVYFSELSAYDFLKGNKLKMKSGFLVAGLTG